ncbi:uncharacterized protein LOC106655581 isoform X1 [Trichogramma pretiosum]|uniref:uncharacterized protein LOC106655581 isoform X1 n=1 Tax=Trichogramma pretiosum TaxID=7493 RepID=UPI0006C9B709|nr:uncharacterized protein LOC106655581 isoform X1 [Trichogramma pretiosum]
MKPSPVVADEMFPEGVHGRYLPFEMVADNMEDIVSKRQRKDNVDSNDEGDESYDFFQAGGSGPIVVDIAGDEKSVHIDFYNDFDDLFDDNDLD